MFRVTKNHLTTVLTLAALLAVVFFSAGQAEAGTQMPPWKKLMMRNAAITPPAPASTPANDNQTQLVEEVKGPESQDNGNNGDQAVEVPGNGGTPGTPGHGGKAPAAAPTPSAVAGGLAMLGLIAGRRRRHADSETA